MSLVEKRIRDTLSRSGIKFEETEHEPVYTSREAAQVRSIPEEAGIKSLVFKTREGAFILVLSPGNREVDTKKIACLASTKSLLLARPDEVLKVAGVPVGCVPPFGHRTALRTYINEELLESEYLYFSAGSHTKTIGIRSEDLLRVLKDPIVFR